MALPRSRRSTAPFALAVAGLSLLGCGSADTPEAAPAPTLCDDAAAKLSACFPEQPASDACHAGTAQRILDASCDELASADTKADGGWICFWNPFLCAGGGSDTPAEDAGHTLFVGASRCGADLAGFDDCTYYFSSPCTAIAVLRDGEEVARGFTSQHGNARFDGLAAGDYEVRVLDRDGAIPQQVTGLVSSTYSPASAQVTLGGEAEARVAFDLPHDSEAAVVQCAPVTVEVAVQTASGEPVVAQDVEWQWFVRFEQADGTVGILRPFAFHPDATGRDDYINQATFHRIYAGTHTVEFIRMDIPSWRQRNNPDYADLLDRYPAEDVAPVVLSLSLGADQVPEGARLTHTLVDPLSE